MALKSNNIKAPKGKNNYAPQPPLESGTYPARLWNVVDLGLQAQRPYQGQEKPPAYTISVTYELLDEFMVDENGEVLEDKPRVVGEMFPIYNLEQDKAKSTKRYLALDPTQQHDGDWGALVGLPCMLTIAVVEKGDKTYTNVTNVAAMRPKEAAKAPELVNPPYVLDLDNPSKEVFEKLPEWLQNKVKENLEFNGSKLEAVLNGKVQQAKQPEPDQNDAEEEQAEGGDDIPW